jgi:hypothetical protein
MDCTHLCFGFKTCENGFFTGFLSTFTMSWGSGSKSKCYIKKILMIELDIFLMINEFKGSKTAFLNKFFNQNIKIKIFFNRYQIRQKF